MAQQAHHGSTGFRQAPEHSSFRFPLIAIAALLTLTILASAEAEQDSNATQLVQGKSVEREISSGQIHSYEIPLNTNQYIYISIDKSDADLTVSFLNPVGQKLIESNGCRRAIIPVSLIAETSGKYQLNIQSREKAKPERLYKLIIEQLREATAQDRSNVAAEMAFNQAEALRAEWKMEALRKAIKKYSDAQAHWQAGGNEQRQATALINIGEILCILNNYKEAIDYYNRALLLDHAAGASQRQIESFNHIANAYVLLGDNQSAINYCNKSLQLSQEIGDRRGRAQALNNMGEAYYYMDQQKAFDLFSQSLAIWQELNDRAGQAQALSNLGYIYKGLGDINNALLHHERARGLWSTVNERRGEALAITAIGGIYSFFDDNQKALDLHQQAALLFSDMGDSAGESIVSNDMGYVYEDLGEKEKALDFYSRALQLCQAVKDKDGEAFATVYIGRVFQGMENYPQALKYFNEALALTRSLSNRALEANTLIYIGQVYAMLGDGEKARENYQQALSLCQAVGDRRGEAKTLDSIGNAYEVSGDKQKALSYFLKALAIMKDVQDRSSENGILNNLARVERDMGKVAEGLKHAEAAFKITESRRGKVASQQLRASYLASVHQSYELYVDLLMQSYKQRPSEESNAIALHISERARARSLLEILTEARDDIRKGVEPTLLGQLDSLKRQIDARERARVQLLARNHTDQEAASAERQLATLITEYREILAEIRAKSPSYAALTQPQPLTLKEIQQRVLDPDTMLLEYALGDQRSYLWAVTQTTIESFELPGRKEIEAQAKRVYELLTARQSTDDKTPKQYQERVARADADYWPQAARLSQTLLGPVVSQLGTKRLLVVTEGALQYIPFAALPVPVNEAAIKNDETRGALSLSITPHPLIVDHEIVTLPSASVLAILRREVAGRKPAAKAVAVLADPVFDKDDYRIKSSKNLTAQSAKSASGVELTRALRDVGATRDGLNLQRLKSSREEAEAILKVTPAQDSFEALDFKATREMAMSAELGQYRIVHFATHGLLNNEHPELSGIVFSLVNEQGNSQNGFLRLHDIYNLNLPAELVVLSGCRTGLGKEIRGEGLVGLTRGFMYAGAARVMASLWNVRDTSTARLMERFYQAMMIKRLPPAAALRAAQIEMLNHAALKAPYHWAAFVLQGEWK